jgi:hypothetical protein
LLTAIHPAPAEGRGDQAKLGALINIAGRQRMLAHRAVMFLALSQAPGVGEAGGALDEAAAALDAFQGGVGLLLKGDAGKGQAPLTSPRAMALLSRPSRSGRSGCEELEGFGLRGRTCLERLRRGEACGRELRSLAELAGEVLLPLLNGIVAALEADLADAVTAEAERTAEVRAVMAGALEDIEQTATRIRLIAFNALIEAARAGQSGRAFSVIAEEIRMLGAQTGAESARMQAAVRRLFAA